MYLHSSSIYTTTFDAMSHTYNIPSTYIYLRYAHTLSHPVYIAYLRQYKYTHVYSVCIIYIQSFIYCFNISHGAKNDAPSEGSLSGGNPACSSHARPRWRHHHLRRRCRPPPPLSPSPRPHPRRCRHRHYCCFRRRKVRPCPLSLLRRRSRRRSRP